MPFPKPFLDVKRKSVVVPYNHPMQGKRFYLKKTVGHFTSLPIAFGSCSIRYTQRTGQMICRLQRDIKSFIIFAWSGTLGLARPGPVWKNRRALSQIIYRVRCVYPSVSDAAAAPEVSWMLSSYRSQSGSLLSGGPTERFPWLIRQGLCS